VTCAVTGYAHEQPSQGLHGFHMVRQTALVAAVALCCLASLNGADDAQVRAAPDRQGLRVPAAGARTPASDTPA
jgi:hypothetical protein